MPSDGESPTVVDAAPAAPESAHPLFFGERWRAVALLGTGGMGSVYLAHDSELGELVAIKMVRPSVALAAGMLERFREEVRLARRVSSPYVARTHDLGEHEGRLFLTMQYVEGESLSARLKREGPLPLREVVRIARDLCAGLDAVHEAGVVHRDLKPANVLLAKDGRAVITDFGIALRTSESGHGDRSATPTYASPEQLAGGAVDARSDVFALGALLFAAATGTRPFPAGRSGREPPPDVRAIAPGLPLAFAGVVQRAMALSPADRFESAGALWDALAPLAVSESREEDRLFAFVRSICRSGRALFVTELAGEGVTPALRDAIRHHLVARLSESGDVRVAATEAEADATLAGGIALRGDAASMQLALHSRDGDEFWRSTFEGAAGALPRLAESAAAAIAGALSAGSRPVDDGAALPSREAVELFFEARTAYRQLFPGHLKHAIALLERVEALAPDNPTVLAWKAAALTRLRFFEAGPDRAHELIDRAQALGSREALPHVARAEACLQDMRVVDAARSFVVALELAPGAPDVRESFAHFLGEVGAFEPALRLTQSLPGAGRNQEVAMRLHAVRGRFDEVSRLAEEAHAAGLVRASVAAMRYALWSRDRRSFERAFERTNDASLDPVTRSLREVTRAAIFDGVFDRRHTDPVMPLLAPRRRAVVFQIGAEIAAFLRHDEYFFDCIDGAAASGLFDAPWIDGCPLFDVYRGAIHFETARRTIHRRAYDALAEIDRVLAG